MYPSGTIYQKGATRKRHGELFLQLPLHTKIIFGFLRGIGAGLMGFVIIGAIFSYGPIIKEELYYDLGIPKDNLSSVDLIEAKNTLEVQTEARELGVDSYFSLVIPKLNAKSNIIANVDPGNAKEYNDALLKGIAHAKGTYFPGQGKRVYLFAHSTDANPFNVAKYNAVFYLLRKLEKGDTITVYFADKKFNYEVAEKHVVSANDVSWITKDSQTEELVLQTCDPPATTWKRLLIIAKPI